MTLHTLVADENIPGLERYCPPGVSLRRVAGRSLTREMLVDAQALLVRSVTPVNASLLSGTPVRFVGTATSGLDHIDSAWLQAEGIGFAAAPGSNADSVVDYVFSALASLHAERGLDWTASRVGIIGVGQIGGRLARRLLALGLDLCLYDPFLPLTHPLAPHFASLNEVLACDIISLHTPLTRTGPYPTFHLFDETLLSRLGPGQLLINAARGAVINNQALLTQCLRGEAPCLVLDAWENEPSLSLPLLAQTAIATPHIAGYSLEGKWRGTRQVMEALSSHFSLPRRVLPDDSVAPLQIRLDNSASLCAALSAVILSAYDVRQDDQRLRLQLKAEPARSGEIFDQQRKTYPVRHEFSHFRLHLGEPWTILRESLTALGFALDQPQR